MIKNFSVYLKEKGFIIIAIEEAAPVYLFKLCAEGYETKLVSTNEDCDVSQKKYKTQGVSQYPTYFLSEILFEYNTKVNFYKILFIFYQIRFMY